jgi:hypothetical protein
MEKPNVPVYLARKKIPKIGKSIQSPFLRLSVSPIKINANTDTNRNPIAVNMGVTHGNSGLPLKH